MQQGSDLNRSRLPQRRGQDQPASKPAPAPDYSRDIAALAAHIEVVDRQKANSSTVGGIATALGAANKRIDEIKVPEPASMAPSSEAITPAAGAEMRYAREDHRHPRLTSTTYVTLGTNGQATVAFSRSFVNKPGLNLTETDASATTQPLVIRGLAWQRDAQGRYTGVTVQGMRAQMLPQLAVVTGLLTAVITGVNSLVSSLTNFNVFGGSASGATVSVIAVGRSDVAAT